MVRTRLLLFVVFVISFASISCSPLMAQVLTTLHNFGDGTVVNDGITPDNLIQGQDGNFYGAAVAGGANGGGVLFKMTPSGTVTILTSLPAGFSGDDDDVPIDLTQGSDGNFYGQSEEGGSAGVGAIFKLTPTGAFTILHSFGDGSVTSDGENAEGGLVQGGDGSFYGLTEEGGSEGEGTVYRITPSGAETVIHSFNGGSVANDGQYPEAGALVLGSDGIFYGTTIQGGTNGDGTVFKITSSGVETVLYSFPRSIDPNDLNVDCPYGTLLQAADGNFYGTTGYLDGGAIYKITAAGMVASLYSFPSSYTPVLSSNPYINYIFPISPLVQGPGGFLYGTTQAGGTNDTGTIFRINPTGSLTTIHSFAALSGGLPGTNTDGAYPVAAMAVSTDGNLYGTTSSGGTAGDGTIFRFTLPRTPLTIINLSPASVPAGGPSFTLIINGSNFTNATTVLFGATPVTVTARSATQLEVTVPASATATAGPLTVTANDPVNGTDAATLIIAMTITYLSPASTPINGPAFMLTITGTGFAPGATVAFGTTSVPVTANALTQLKVTIPANDITVAGIVSVTVTNPNGGSATAPFDVILAWYAHDVAAVADGTARVLWTRSDGAAGIWVMNTADAQTAVGTTYGPYQGWMAQDVTAAPDGTSRILWNRYDGATGVWVMDAHGNQSAVGPTYGPFTGWKAIDLATAPDGTSRLLWRYTNGEAGLLSLNATGTQVISGRSYGPYTGWTATAVGASGDGTARILWTRSDGAMGIWTMDAGDLQKTVGPTYGPYSDSHGHWTATDLSRSADGTSCVLWKRSDGAVGVWTYSAANAAVTSGPVYGPYPGWTAAAMDAASDKARVLWVNSNREAGLWSFGSNDAETLIGPIYGPY